MSDNIPSLSLSQLISSFILRKAFLLIKSFAQLFEVS